MFALGLSPDGGDDCVLIMPGYKYVKPEIQTPMHRHPMIRKVMG
jgi:hypothetical protein